MVFARKEEHAGACSEGFKTTEFPADIAPITGSNASEMGKFQDENMRTRPSGSGSTCPFAGKKIKGNELFLGAIHSSTWLKEYLTDFSTTPS